MNKSVELLRYKNALTTKKCTEKNVPNKGYLCMEKKRLAVTEDFWKRVPHVDHRDHPMETPSLQVGAVKLKHGVDPLCRP